MMNQKLLMASVLALVFRGINQTAANEPQAASPRIEAPALLPSNQQAPFCYLPGKKRSWPIIGGKLGSEKVTLTARENETVLAQGVSLNLSGLSVDISKDGFLNIHSADAQLKPAFVLNVTLGEVTQSLNVRAAPPNRPLSYVADLLDDIIYIFSDTSTGRFRNIEKSGFDQYFRRLQAQGITRLIVWQSPFPCMADRDSYSDEDWQRYQQQARAIIESDELTEALVSGGKMVSWSWLRQTLALRLDPHFGDKLSQSAAEHGIKLTASFRPFEPALTKYYDVPAFDAAGNYLWGFLPLASPVVNYHPQEVCFANYRTVLAAMGHKPQATLDQIVIQNVPSAEELVQRFKEGHRDFEILAADYPPVAADAFVLQQNEQQRFSLRKFGSIKSVVEKKLKRVSYDSLQSAGRDTLRFTGISVPFATRYLWLKATGKFGQRTEIPAAMPVKIIARAGNRLGRLNQYWALADGTTEAARTQIAPIAADGGFRTEFQAAEFSHSLMSRGPKSKPLGPHTIVIDRGQLWSVEMLDFLRPRARKMAVDQLRHLLSFPAFDEIFINTRSHIQLAASQGDGVDGIQPVAHYFALKRNYQRLGIDRAFTPISLFADEKMLKLAAAPESVEQITTWQPGAWEGTCQSPSSPYVWRFARNQSVAAGVGELLRDLDREFPNRRIRVVIPPSAVVIKNMEDALEEMPKPDGTKYGKDYYRSIWSSLNYIPVIGEGMTMIDLSNTSAEPVFLGIRFAPEKQPFEEFVRQSIRDLAGNRGSEFRGQRSFFYEAQETLRYPARPEIGKRREQIICDLLSQTKEINEVILYEAADWTYKLPLNDADVCGYGFLDRLCSTEAERKVIPTPAAKWVTAIDGPANLNLADVVSPAG